MMAEIGFNLAVYAVPVVPSRPGADERLVRIGDGVPVRHLPPAPRPRPFGALCICGVRGVHRTSYGQHRPA
jgi:hypothetical protein